MSQLIIDDLVVDVIRKDIKHVYFSVYPPNGRVRVSAPHRYDDEAIRLAVISKLPWIERHRARFAGLQRRQKLEYVSGEYHDYQGQPYLLNVVYSQGPPTVKMHSNSTLDLLARPGSDAGKREQVMIAWYRQQLKEAIPPLIAKWEGIIGEDVAEWGVKRMKTRWGSCNIKARRIWLNLELIKRPVSSLEYIIVHEMVHFKERLHNRRFKAHMDRYLPQWRSRQEELEEIPLAYAHLGY